jgi:cation diffusion facilitator family transporter
LLAALAGNAASVVVKLVFGFLANSIAMMADAVHSVFDSASSVIGIYGTKVSARPPDLDHPYGHGKYEQVAALGITVMMFVAFFNIVHEAIDRAIANVMPTITPYSFAAMGISMLISLLISIYERKIGKATSSMILIADSSHTLTDVFASAVVIAGFVGTKTGLRYADPLAATLVCLFIAYVGYSIFRGATSTLVDQGITLDTLLKVKATVNGLSEDVECHSVRGKTVGDKIYIDMHVTFRGDLSVEQAHKITETIEEKLKETIKGTQEVIIHVEPKETKNTTKTCQVNPKTKKL